MASIENRSHYVVTVKQRDDLSRTFAHDTKARAKAAAYIQSLQDQGYRPKLGRLDNYYAIRDRSVTRAEQTLYAYSKSDAEAIKARLEYEHQQSLFVNYALGYKTSLADLMIRYLREEAPRHKSFEVEAYKINAMLEDAGLPRLDLGEIVTQHKNPHPKVAAMKLRKATGTRMGRASEASKFIRKAFATVVPDDFTDYIDERCQIVEASTVDREIDIFSAVCNIAIDVWRIPVAKNPMDGVRRPRYYNERDRRLVGDEEARLLAAARAEDREQSIARRLEELMSAEREEANGAETVYRRKKVVKDARQRYLAEAEATYIHVPLLETLIQFQLMTGARRSETLTLTWSRVNLACQTALLPDTKNGRARKLPLRLDLIEMLDQLPRTDDCIFPIGVDGLRKAWKRICEPAGLTGEHELRIHDLRHEAISRVAEAGSNTRGGFSLVDLQHFSGHRDVRMLLRYAHLCTQSLAKRLDAAFASNSESVDHHGRRRLTARASVTLKDIVAESAVVPDEVAESDNAPAVVPANVIRIDFGTRAA
ncbi:integrase [Burkholderia pseudomallei]|nr:integrase [Burkholderia pseudomallei]CAJ3985093.1 integrase [Burkholderia pseudomallei]CAJ4119705.1 integrase [Burkholderia pseudomallei]CAJ4123786.1 integrase [Burkholderia pseudomallei]CAJ4554528.1 integrase [Burkholderia pseudomallei]